MHPEATSDAPSDAALVGRAAAGDSEAFGAIYSRYQQMVYRFARTMTGSADVAADVTQEVFTTLIRDLTRYNPRKGALPTYLYGIARNLSRERLRRDRRFEPLLSDAGASFVRYDDPAERMADAEAAARMRRVLGSLPQRYREVIVLCDLHDLAYADAAAVIRAPVGAVRWRLHRGRRLLRERLQRLERQACRPASTAARCAI